MTLGFLQSSASLVTTFVFVLEVIQYDTMVFMPPPIVVHSFLRPLPKLWTHFCRAILCKRGLCRRAVSVRLSVTFLYSANLFTFYSSHCIHITILKQMNRFSANWHRSTAQGDDQLFRSGGRRSSRRTRCQS